MASSFRKRRFVPIVGVLVLLLVLWKTDTLTEPQIYLQYVSKSIDRYTKSSNVKVFMKEYIPEPYVHQVNCRAIAKRDEKEIRKAEAFQANPNNTESYNGIKDKVTDCKAFRKQRRYTMKPVNQEEAEFPIAFSILMHQDPEQVERLLRAVYRPQNYYCVHIDKKSANRTFEVMKSIIRCFDNVFLLPTSIDVAWGQYTVILPEFKCMEQLWKYKKWKYFINLTGQEFPLQTNLFLVKMLKIINGAAMAEGTVRRHNAGRTAHKKPFKANVTIAKGAVHVVVPRKFVDYILHDKTALEFREWVKDTGHPEEIFFPSLIHSPQLNVPGAYKGIPESWTKGYPYINRVKIWAGTPFPCRGMFKKSICIFGIGDLHYLYNQNGLFANKFYKTFHPLVYDCLEEIHYNNTIAELLGTRTFNSTFYKSLNIVTNHV